MYHRVMTFWATADMWQQIAISLVEGDPEEADSQRVMLQCNAAASI